MRRVIVVWFLTMLGACGANWPAVLDPADIAVLRALGTGLTVVLMIVVTIGVDPGAVAERPDFLIFALSMLAAVTLLSTALMPIAAAAPAAPSLPSTSAPRPCAGARAPPPR